MFTGAYSSQFKNLERQQVDSIKTLAENEKSDAIARARKLSVETNKRRRALAIKHKAEGEREERRRRQILAKRREEQQEATEKFQRAHIHSRTGSSSSGTCGRWSPRHGTASDLEDALCIVRGSPVSSRISSAQTRDACSPYLTSPNHQSCIRQNSDPLAQPYFNKYAHPMINKPQPSAKNIKQEQLHNKSLRNLNTSRNLFEQQLESYQQSLFEQQQKTLQDFNLQVMREIGECNVENGNGELEISTSLSSVDSLEESDSNNTLRGSCDLDAFLSKTNDNFSNGTSNVAVAATTNNKKASDTCKMAENSAPQSTDSYSLQMQSLLKTQEKLNEEKQCNFLQRQKEIQQQLQEQQCMQQLKQQDEFPLSFLEQQQKQKQLLLQQFDKQEQLEKQRQFYQQQQKLPSKSIIATNSASDENMCPKVQFKAWSTPSPHPPTPQNLPVTKAFVTHASPCTGKNTYTNTTVTTYEKGNTNSYNTQKSTIVSNENEQKISYTVKSSGTPPRSQDTNGQYMSKFKVTDYTSSPVSGHDKNMFFLESAMNGLSSTAQISNQNGSSMNNTSAKQTVQMLSLRCVNQSPKPGILADKETETKPGIVAQTETPTKVAEAPPAKISAKFPAKMTTPSAVALAKMPVSSLYSYGAAYAARQQAGGGPLNKQENSLIQNSHTIEKIASNENITSNISSFGELLPQADSHLPVMMNRDDKMNMDDKMNRDDNCDTDSISTICDEKEIEPKEARSILKNTDMGKKVGILKKSGSSNSVKDIRDSLEITRVHLQTNTEEKEPRPPIKKNVRFADIHYDNVADYDVTQDLGEERLFIKRDTCMLDINSKKLTRPVSAVTVKTISQNLSTKPPRATSATYRTSSIQRAKTQIVRPQAKALVITQNTQNLDSTVVNDIDKKVIVNSDFLGRMSRANQTSTSVSAFSSTNSNFHNSSPENNASYAVSSILMPKTDGTPFMSSGFNSNTQGPSQVDSKNGPLTMGNGIKRTDAGYGENSLHRTPTDDEIDILWDRLRSYLSYTSNTTPNGQGLENQRLAAPVSHTYVNGNSLGQLNSLNRVAQQQLPGSINPLIINGQNSLDSGMSSYQKRYGLLQQRKQQLNPNSLKVRQQQQQELAACPPPLPSTCEPEIAPTVLSGDDQVTESLAGFVVAEQLADLSVADSRINEAIDEAQITQQVYNAARPQTKVKSALSMEEQRLLESLDNLNNKLKAAEATIPNTSLVKQLTFQSQRLQSQQPFIHVKGFKDHVPLSQQGVPEGPNLLTALKITSVNPKCNPHR